MFIRFPEAMPPAAGWSLDDVLSIDSSEGLRLELHEGTIVVTPPPSAGHQEVDGRLIVYFHRLGRVVYSGIGIAIDEHNFRIPDLVVLRPGRSVVAEEHKHPADVVDIAVEIVSPTSRDQDRIIKPKVYAGVGIPQYWRVEPGPEGYVVFMHELRDGAYVHTREVPLRQLTA
ncbi:Uma2 family endonuclease [Dactylosporangium darangshiense]|uniref:Uma2 family endonuclease n=2 Tax=Dactylosporangium darangshiense TaxID=579108 RepID=A0ABP8D667_9ACTN